MAGDDRPLARAFRAGTAEKLVLVDDADIGKLQSPFRQMVMVTYSYILGGSMFPNVNIVVPGELADVGKSNSPSSMLEQHADSLVKVALATGRLRSTASLDQVNYSSRGTFFFTTPTSARTVSCNLLYQSQVVTNEVTGSVRVHLTWCDKFTGVSGNDRVSDDKFSNAAAPK
jgi:hypothetical protein